MLHHFQQAWVGAEKVLPEVRAALDEIFLILAVGDLAHAPNQEAFAVVGDERIPVGAPDHFDNVPSDAAEDRFQFLDDLAVAAHGTVEALEIAVDDEDQVVEFFACRERDSSERFGFIRFAVPQECEYLAASAGFQATVLKVLDET